jgi:GNAT superfamily N-acetyltransferase
MEFNVIERAPTPAEYNQLRKCVGWSTFEERLIKTGLSNSLYSVMVTDSEGSVVGMGRIVGDNAIYMHLQDIIVRPEYQRKGIGRMIVLALLDYVYSHGGHNTNIGLMSSKGREKFYEGFGFVERPNEKWGGGMMKVLD